MEGTSSCSGPLFKCEVEGCGYSCNRADNLKIHLKNKHKIINLSTVKRARFSCPVEECTKKYYHAKQPKLAVFSRVEGEKRKSNSYML